MQSFVCENITDVCKLIKDSRASEELKVAHTYIVWHGITLSGYICMLLNDFQLFLCYTVLNQLANLYYRFYCRTGFNYEESSDCKL